MQEPQKVILEEIVSVLPNQVELYHLGRVELQDRACSWQDATAVGFRLFGEQSALVILLFDKDLDESIYSEFGNILVSQIAAQLSSKAGIDLMISPPIRLSDTQVMRLTQHTSPIRRTYVHFYKNSMIPIETLILANVVEETGYA